MEPNFLNVTLNRPISTRKPIVYRKYTFIKRMRANVPSVAEHILSLEAVTQMKQTHKCSKHCLNRLLNEEIQKTREQYVPLSALKKNKWIRNYFAFNKIAFSTSNSIRWHINGKDTCKKCWM
jgi:hypothetical protein